MFQISDFLAILENDLNKGVTSIDSILGQCMYFGLSFSKVGCDFRTLMVPIFTKAIATNFKNMVLKATMNFEKNMERFTLINRNHPNVPWKTKNPDPIQPPDSLLEFYPLAEYLNQVLAALNDLKLCAPISIVCEIYSVVQESLLFISRGILVLYGQEQQAFSQNSRDAFTRLCMSFTDDLLPYVQKCLQVVYPPNTISSHIGISVQDLQQEAVCILNKSVVVDPIKHLLPVKIEPSLTLASNFKQSRDGSEEQKSEYEVDLSTEEQINEV